MIILAAASDLCPKMPNRAGVRTKAKWTFFSKFIASHLQRMTIRATTAHPIAVVQSSAKRETCDARTFVALHVCACVSITLSGCTPVSSDGRKMLLTAMAISTPSIFA